MAKPRVVELLAPRTCEQCKQTIKPWKNSTVKRYLARRFCDWVCASAFRQQPLQICERAECDNAFRPPDRRIQRFCSNSCSGFARRHSDVDNYLNVMVDGKRVAKHRHVMEQRLGRPLHPWETVHHKNGKRRDNSDDNLELWAVPQPYGQRVSDLVAFVAKYYQSELQEALAA